MDKSELQKNISKIKKLLTQRDIGLIDSGIEILRALDQKEIYEELLKDCSINEYGGIEPSKIFSGTAPSQPYLNYALLNLIAYAPEKTKLNKSLKRDNIKSLSLAELNITLIRLDVGMNSRQVFSDFQERIKKLSLRL